MRLSITILLMINGVLVTVLSALSVYLRLKKTAIKKRLATSSLNKELNALIDHPIMRYADYKKEFASRSRDIAIVGHSKQPHTLETIMEFTETMRENGSYMYHFTNYWGGADHKDTQRSLTDVIQANYDGILTIGTGLTKLARTICLTNDKYPPIVFARVVDELWQREQKKKLVANMTGITVKDNSEYYIRMFLSIKPFMRSALIPITHPVFTDIAQRLATLLNNYGVTAHVIRVQGNNELINTLSHYRDRVDSLILTRDTLPTELSMLLAQKCSEYQITFFSSVLKDVTLGAAIAIGSVNENYGQHAAQRMLSIIEDNKLPIDLPLISVDQFHQHEIHFNQIAMQTQGIDPSRITTVALQHSTKIYAVFNKDITI